MLRWAFTFVAGCSLVLGAGALVLERRSWRGRATVEFRRAEGVWEVRSERGRIWVDNEPQRQIEAAAWSREASRLMDECVAIDVKAAALRARRREVTGGDTAELEAELVRVAGLAAANRRARGAFFARTGVMTPVREWSVRHGVVVAAAGVGPVAWVGVVVGRRVRRGRRLRKGRCVACGYDLRGSAGRCPECGVERVR